MCFTVLFAGQCLTCAKEHRTHNECITLIPLFIGWHLLWLYLSKMVVRGLAQLKAELYILVFQVVRIQNIWKSSLLKIKYIITVCHCDNFRQPLIRTEMKTIVRTCLIDTDLLII